VNEQPPLTPQQSSPAQQTPKERVAEVEALPITSTSREEPQPQRLPRKTKKRTRERPVPNQDGESSGSEPEQSKKRGAKPKPIKASSEEKMDTGDTMSMVEEED